MLLSTKGISIQKVLKRLPNHFALLHQSLHTVLHTVNGNKSWPDVALYHQCSTCINLAEQNRALELWRQILPAHTDQFVAVGTFAQSHGVHFMACQHTPPHCV